MYCSKCGKEIFDEAVMCPNCKTMISTEIISNKNTVSQSIHPNEDDLRNDIQTIKVLGILSIIFCLGIGFIFAIIGTIKIRKIFQTNYVIPNINEKEIQNEIKLSNIFFSISIVIFCIGISSLMIAVLFLT